MNNTRRVFSYLIWAGVAVSTAAPVNAEVLSSVPNGSYAACSANYIADDTHPCMPAGAFYIQNIHIWSESCNQGACQDQEGMVWTQFIYPSGRKTANFQGWTCGDYYRYTLGDCGC
jgi:hypothetical protein